MTAWIEPEKVPVEQRFADLVGGHPLVAEILTRRGIPIDEVRGYLDPKEYKPASSFELPGMAEAVARIEQAIKTGEKICVWGDFDVDGQTATSVLVEGLTTLEANVFHHIPIRAKESHGMNIPALQTVIQNGATLVVTCDTGIAEHESLAYARSVGVDVVVTDHHTLPESLPVAVALVNSQMVAPEHPLRTLPGVGVAYKLVEALYERAGKRDKASKLLDLVALGIVADLAGLRGDTRYLLQLGLEVLRNTDRVGLKALYEAANVNAANLNEETIGFSLAPRMNALGRLDDANPMVEFLTTDDMTKAQVMASRLEGMNEERRLITEQIYEGALSQLKQNPELAQYNAIVLAQENWEAGIIGIVASRIVEQFNKPAILIALSDDGIGKGSARSVDSVNITEAITMQRELLNTFGGHPMAAGLSLDVKNIEQFRKDLSHTISEMTKGFSFEPELHIGGYLKFEDISFDLIQDIDRISPFGAENPSLTFAVRNVRIKTVRKIGRNNEHLRLVIESTPDLLQEVLFWRADEDDLPDGRFDLAFNLRVNDFRGERQIQATWVDARPVEKDDAPIAERRSAKTYDVIDCRLEALDEAQRELLSEQENAIFWGEGVSEPTVVLLQRDDLESAETLVIWTAPPDLQVLRKVLDKVHPVKVYLCGHIPENQKIDLFIGRLAGLVKFTMKENGGRVTLRRLAGAVAQGENVVLKGLEWFAEAGHFNHELTGRSIILRKGEGVPGDRKQQIQEELARLLAESDAFRRHYLSASPEQLLGKRRG